MTDLAELRKTLLGMEAGEYASIHYDHYAKLFFPGEPDQAARAVCHEFAKSVGCRIENKQAIQEIWFVKDKAPNSLGQATAEPYAR